MTMYLLILVYLLIGMLGYLVHSRMVRMDYEEVPHILFLFYWPIVCVLLAMDELNKANKRMAP